MVSKRKVGNLLFLLNTSLIIINLLIYEILCNLNFINKEKSLAILALFNAFCLLIYGFIVIELKYNVAILYQCAFEVLEKAECSKTRKK